MQSRSRQYGVVAILALTAGLAACSSSTAPKPITSQQLATDFDALYSADLAAGTHADSNAAQFIAMYVEIEAAYGGTEASFSTSGTSWKGVGFAVAQSATDTEYLIALYPNRNLQELVLLEVTMSNGTPVGASSIATTDGFQSTEYEDSVATATAAMQSTGSGCSQQSGLAADAFMTNWVGSATVCTLAKWHETFSVSYASASGIGTVSGTNVTFNGPFFTPSGASRVVGIPSKGAAALQNLLARFHQAR